MPVGRKANAVYYLKAFKCFFAVYLVRWTIDNLHRKVDVSAVKYITGSWCYCFNNIHATLYVLFLLAFLFPCVNQT